MLQIYDMISVIIIMLGHKQFELLLVFPSIMLMCII